MNPKGLRLLCLGFVYFFCSSSAQADLKVGVVFFDPPLVMSATQGFQVALANRICEGLQEKCIIIPMQLKKLFIALDQGDIDLQMGVYITPERAKKYIFSNPFRLSRGRFISLTEYHLTSVQQLAGEKVGTRNEEEKTGVFFNYIQANYFKLFDVVGFDDVNSLLNALANKSIKGGLLHSSAIDFWIVNSSGIFSAVGPSFPLGAGQSIMALPSNQQLINKVNMQLKEMKADGDYAKIYNRYFSSKKWGE